MNPPGFADVCSAGTLRGPLAPPLDARAAALSDRLAIGARIGRPDRHAAPPRHDLRRRRRLAHEPVRALAPTDPATRGSSLRRDVIDGGRRHAAQPRNGRRRPTDTSVIRAACACGVTVRFERPHRTREDRFPEPAHDLIDGGRRKPLDPIAAERAPSFGAGAPARRGLVMPNAEGPTREEPSS
jgi:hypothetical protein